MVFCIMAQTRSSTCPKQHKSVEQDRVEGQSEQISVSAAEVGCAQGHGRTRVAFTRESTFSFISLDVFQSASNTPPVSCEPGLRVK